MRLLISRVRTKKTPTCGPWPYDIAIGHTCNGSERHRLEDHLRGTAALAREFAQSFGGGDFAYWAGLWHDVGKFSSPFQDYLRECEESDTRSATTDHKAAGCILAAAHLEPLAFLIQGHHGGLLSRVDLRSWVARNGGRPDVEEALARAQERISDLRPTGSIDLPDWVDDPLNTDLFLRMTYSALVDADSLDTEAHFENSRTQIRSGPWEIAELEQRFLRGRQAMLAEVAPSPVDGTREEVFESCVRQAEHAPGFFRLTVPTGGGKTLSGMAFALRHAVRHGLRRVIVAVPYISITEQTASVYRTIFGDDAVVLEHHSGATETSPPNEDEVGEHHPADLWARLAAENWDAPIVVTTTVQLFESLFSNMRNRTRKLHALANSVVILDEVQSLPIKLLDPMLDVLRRLSEHYRTTVVLSTATQPAFDLIPAFSGVEALEINSGYAAHFEGLRRVDYSWHTESPLEWSEIGRRARVSGQALLIVNTKAAAMSLMDELGEDPTVLHLSTLLCGAHRRAVLEDVKRRLNEGEPCLLVSTQVVEAGVDIDFPVVYRAVGPLDSIIQAAGRCNRSGRLARGEVVVFQPVEVGMPPGQYSRGAQITLGLATRDLDPNDLKVLTDYYRRLLSTEDPDVRSVQDLRRSLDYPEVANRMRLIDDDTVDLIVRYEGLDEAALNAFKDGRPGTRHHLRRLRTHTVAVRRHKYQELVTRGLATSLMDGVGEWHGPYDAVRGIGLGGFRLDEMVI